MIKPYKAYSEARKRKAREKNRKRAAELGLTSTEYGLLKYAHLKAELSAKPDETLEQTKVRALKIWHEEVEKSNAEHQRLIDMIMSLPDEKQRRMMMNKMRS